MIKKTILIRGVPCKLVPSVDKGICFGCYIWDTLIPTEGFVISCRDESGGIPCEGKYTWKRNTEINKQTRTI